MKKLLPLMLLAAAYAQAQTSPPPGTLSATEILKHQRRHDSMQVVIAQRRKEITAYNRTHPIKKSVSKPTKKRL